ncbi:hypothetical protein NIES2119_16295 [[Phormidium ambiguum] IAM M-71]|uniref:Uncharacterized protein n=1 Tax=[Phormidium ambiguum] IAM M-71 TaxID=454136 RepID=A0A1U7IHN4_9CYAN|nr:hypothetical protein [Phormidium ambiguum]OKH36590.1 hypothetical protein NIES2119_16295 [Phormidium ambiguum IAM M-71]
MVNVLSQGDNELVTLDYSDLLQKITQILKNNNIFKLSENSDRLLIDIDEVANQVANLQIQNPLTSAIGVRSATINFTPQFREKFPKLIRNIRDCLRQSLESNLGQNPSIGEFVNSLITPLEQFQGNQNQKLGFTFAFNKQFPNLQKQKLILDRQSPGSGSLLKFHKLTIRVQNTNQFTQQLRQGLENYIEQIAESETESEDLNDILAGMVRSDRSDFHRLQRIVDTETLGKLKKEAKIRYLEYLRDNCETTDKVGKIYLQDLIRRLRLIETYINDPTKADDYYEVNYANTRINYREVFSRSEVLDALPIITIVAGNLGESTDKNQGGREFIFGLKMKLNNAVQALGGDDVFDYNLTLIDPTSKKHQEELKSKQNFGAKVLRLAFLYYFVFASRSNPEAEDYNPNSELEYDPVSVFDQKVLPILRSSDDGEKNKLFLKLLEGFAKYKAKLKVNKLKQFLKDIIEKQTILPTRNYPIQIGVRNGILERDIDSIFSKQTFFDDVVATNHKECLRFISIGESYIDETALCQLPANITIEDIRYFTSQESQEFKMGYEIKDIGTLPILWVPETCMKTYKDAFMQHKLILFRYNNRRLDDDNKELDSTKAFIYRFTFSLLGYLCLNILLESIPNSLFIPMVRLHEGDRKNPAPSEKFVAHFAKSLSHLLSEKHRVSSQGFRIHNLNKHSINNGLSSLYSVLPKKFRFSDASNTPNLKKLAIIVVSSLESDAMRSNRNRFNRISNLQGEVIGINRRDNGIIDLEILKTISDNYHNERLYRDPPILLDTVNNLYEDGYRNFLYIAQAPYTSTLNITQTDENEGLYFMSPKLIEELKGNRQDIKIYPIFFDKYYVRRSRNLHSSSFYIQDTRQLYDLAEDPSQKVVMFFNLFNGITVGKNEERFYNGVISYSTLLKVYSDILNDKDIMMGLIDDDSTLKNDILQYLTLFHFSRFEKDSNISLKLDPYQNIIGEEAFSKLSVFNHIRGEIEFNSLAFLTEVKQVLNV